MAPMDTAEAPRAETAPQQQHPRPEEGTTRAVKRVRFACSVSSNDATTLAIATDADQVEAQTLETFAPKFTYHAFGTDEVVDGFTGLKISVCFNGFDFRAWLDVQFKEKEPTADDVVAKLTPSLPEGFTQDKTRFVSELRKSAQDFTGPPGTLVDSYSMPTQAAESGEAAESSEPVPERFFEIYECKLEDNTAAQQLLANLQTMSLWFIEGADAVDVTDPRWVLYLLYERSEASGGAFLPAGFVTLFKFFNPLGRKAAYCTPEQNETHRICQVLVFPTHQRQGHGEHLVQCIHTRTLANERVYELTVEDPVPAFASLRDLVDLKNCAAHGFFSLAPEASADAGSARGTAALTTADIHAVQQTLKLTHKQVQTCYEARKLALVDTQDAEKVKKYRLEVKKRLFHLHTEELDGMGSAERRKAFLEAEFQRLQTHYARLMAKLESLPPTLPAGASVPALNSHETSSLC